MIKKVIGVLSLAALPLISGNAEAHGRYHHHHHAFNHHRLHHHHVRRHAAAEAVPDEAAGSSAGAGFASWYRGRGGMTAAHRSLPFGTRVLVTNRSNGRAVVVLINDRGPFIRGRVIDLNRSAALAIGMTGVSPVSLRRL